MISLQQFADETLAPEYRQSLKGPKALIDEMGWGDVDAPMCCGERLRVTSWIGVPYKSECQKCGALAVAVDGPMFENSTCRFLDPEKVDMSTENRWAIIRKKQTDV